MNVKFKAHLFIFSLFFCYNLSAQEIVKGDFKNENPQSSYVPSFDMDATDKPVKNVILMIGDGMGLAHICSGMYANQGQLTITNLKTCGFVRTQSANKFTTDSAASGTAYSTGKKTKNGALGMDENNQVIPNLPEKLSGYGYISGIVTTDNLDGATPAAFFAHQPERGMSKEIWADLPNSKLTFFSAGSYELFEKQAPNVQKEIKKEFTIIEEPNDKAIKKSKKLGYLPTKSKTASVNENRGDFLPSTTQMAIDYLSSRSTNGFFLMVEGGKIDWACHGNDAATVFNEVKDMDDAIKVAYEFYKKHPKETLIVVTADHETGGIVLGTGKYALNLKALQYQKHSADGLSRRISELRKSKGNKVTWEDMKEFLGEEMGFWKQFPISWEQEKKLRDEFEQSFVRNKVVFAESMYSKSEPMAARAKEVMDQISMVGWVSGGHSAGYVPVFAIGAGSQLFGEKIDNTEIPKRIAKAAGYK